MATGTAQLLFGAAHARDGGLFPHVSLWFFEDDHRWWESVGGRFGDVRWTPRSPERAVHDALVMLVAITSGKGDPVPKALDAMAPGIEWRRGHVDVSTWRHYDTEHLDALVAESARRDTHGKLVLSLLDGTSIEDTHLEPLAGLGWDVDVLAPTRVQRPYGDRPKPVPAVPQQRPRPVDAAPPPPPPARRRRTAPQTDEA
jgi:hypothetical protein